MERDDPETTTGSKLTECRLNSCRELVELTIDGDAYRLKDPRRRVKLAASRKDRLDDLREMPRAEDRSAGTLADDGLGDLPSARLLAELGEDFLELRRRRSLHDLVRGPVGAAAHPKVERAVAVEAESAPGVVELEGRDAEIEQNGVESPGHAESLGDHAELREQPPSEMISTPDRLETSPRVRKDASIAIDSENEPIGPDASEQGAGMATGTDGAVVDALTRPDGEMLEHLVEEYRNMRACRLIRHTKPPLCARSIPEKLVA